jgi:hypothetical protein
MRWAWRFLVSIRVSDSLRDWNDRRDSCYRGLEIIVKFGLDVGTTGRFSDARLLAGPAADAEAAGWGGFFASADR